jgi:hypothetical protein
MRTEAELKESVVAIILPMLLSVLLACSGGTHPPDAGVDPVVTDSAVRSCDLLLDTGNVVVGSVGFGDAVVGRYKKDGSRLAVSFVAKVDAAPTGKLTTVLDAAGQPLDAAKFSLSSVTCYDRLGATVQNPGFALQ